MTADVDAFIMTPDIFKPLLLPNRKIWLYRYAFTLGSGSTFMMPFIGAKAHVWKEMIEYDASNDDINKGILGNGLPQMIEKYSKKMNFSDTYTWDVDQHIVSHGILRSGYCSLPSSNKLWNELNLEPRYIGIMVFYHLHSVENRETHCVTIFFRQIKFIVMLLK